VKGVDSGGPKKLVVTKKLGLAVATSTYVVPPSEPVPIAATEMVALAQGLKRVPAETV
jgi:hypothetical protein